MHQKGQRVKNGTFIDAVLRRTAMERSVCYEEVVPSFSRILLAVYAACEAAVQNADEFPFLMPVEWHIIAGMPFLHAIKGEREVGGAVDGLFAKVEIMHISSFLKVNIVPFFGHYITRKGGKEVI